MKMLLCERPYTSQPVGMLARKDGQYTRPILAQFLDVRIEDFMPDSVLVSNNATNYIGRLPDIQSIGQVGKYFVANANLVIQVDLGEAEVKKAMDSGQYLLLPDSPESPYWRFTKSPWWEFCTCFDGDNGYVKAPKIPRANEPTPEEIDEKLDEYPQNRGNLQVKSPQNIEKGLVAAESYIERLRRIYG